jgi:hypothetical protein
MAIQAIESPRHPPAARLQKGDLQAREPITHPTHDQAGGRRPHLKHVRDTMAHGEPVGEPLHRQRGLPAFRPAVDADGKAKERQWFGQAP